ncbi:hypothetical protein LEMLEM_LOCUS23869, partial [Lemmus lemmus]
PKPKFSRHLITLALRIETKVNRVAQGVLYSSPWESVWEWRHKE